MTSLSRLPHLRTFLSAAFVCASCATPLRAEDANEHLTLKLTVADLTPAVTRKIAEIGVPSIETLVEGETLGTVIQRHCGRADENYRDYLKDNSDRLGIPKEQVAFDYKFPAARTIELPYCFKTLETQRSVLIGASGASFSPWSRQIASTDLAAAKRRWSAYASPETFDPSTPLSDSKAMWTDDVGWAAGIQVREEAAYTQLPLRSGVEARTEVAALIEQQPSLKGSAHAGARGTKHVTVLSSEEDKCRARPYRNRPENYPVDTYEILRVLGLNRAARPHLEANALPVIIGDSGLPYDDELQIFTHAGIQGRARDLMSPDESYARSQHGTYVATAALGGPYFMRFWRALDFPIKIRAHNVISRTSGCTSNGLSIRDHCEIDDDKLTNVLKLNGRAGIVNLSVSNEGKIDAFESEFQEAQGAILVVAAAGNTGVEIAPQSYPARLMSNRNYSPYLIVVAALQKNGARLSENSSWHKSWVELAAFGCHVPVYKYTMGSQERNGAPNALAFKIVRQSGTSMAAPLVTFAAALLRKQISRPPAMLKKRLLVSADYEPGLADQVKNGAKLNIARALAVYHDVVRLKERRPIYGQLEKGENFLLGLCNGVNSKRRKELLSLSIYPSIGGSRIFAHHGPEDDRDRPSADESLPIDCELGALGDREMVIEDAETNAKIRFKLKDVRNITLAYEPYWEN